ncbi:MAG TPA: PEP-CTERM sorting domain-containing protein [Tepidisphaeraceae bacterium]|nr:PEP-CTERM sorting domain-containing protein [Tepidisphaeraceae bacterium]
MQKKLMFVALAALSASSWASGAVVSGWSFEALTLPNTPGTTPPAPSAGSFLSDTGNGTMSGTHASAATVWSTPAGNGTAKALSSNNWGVGDYYEFTSDLTGFEDVIVTFDQTGSGTGPRDFKLQYSSTGIAGPYIDAGSYALTLITFNAVTGVNTTPPRFLFDLSAITALDDNANAAFRITTTSAVSINGAAVGTGGTGRIDTVLVEASEIPEPGTLALAGMASAGLLIRRRK